MSATTVAFIAPEATMPNSSRRAAGSITGAANPRLFTSPSGVVYELVHVTPELAGHWLERNTANRPMRDDVVDKLSRDREAGRFLENGDAIRFAEDGQMLDGQHRAEMIRRTGKPTWVLVVSNLPKVARDTIDDGVKRTMGDRFAFHGEASPKTLAAVVRRALLWERQAFTNAAFQPSALESFEFLDANPDLREAAAAADHYRKARLLAASTIGLCWWLFRRLDAGQCQEFFDRLADGANLPRAHPVLTLRNRLNVLNAQPGRVPASHSTALVVKAWNYYRDGKPLTTLRFADHEKFPTPK